MIKIVPTSGMSIGPATMVPPAPWARLPAALTSSTTTWPTQCEGAPPWAGPNPPCCEPFAEIIG